MQTSFTRWLAVPLLLVLGWLLRPATAAVTLEAPRTTAGKYEKLELLLRLDGRFQNPFDPDEGAVSVRITTPAGKQHLIPAFFCQDYERRQIARSGRAADWIYPVGQPVWKARFAPTEIGRYAASAEVNHRGQVTRSANSLELECTRSENRGFLRVSRGNPRVLEFSEGQAFFAIGQNLAFIGPGQYVTLSKAEQIFGKLGENGANFLRIWTGCEDWALAIEARRSAWGRSWSKSSPLVPSPDAPADSPRKCVKLSGQKGTALGVAPTSPLAVRPDTRYVLSGNLQTEGQARLRLEVNGTGSVHGGSSSPGKPWTPFRVEFRTAAEQYWLEAMNLRLDEGGTAWIDGLSLKEAAGGPELLGDADPNRPVLGFYHSQDAFMLDQVVEAAHEHGIYLQLCLLNRNLYMDMLRKSESPEYAQATKYARHFLRYCIARWGYSTHVAAWEYFNEIDPGLPTDRFYQELGEYLEEIDVHHHLRTTSTWSPSPKDWRHPKLDIAQMHHYLRPASGDEWKDEVGGLLKQTQFLKDNTPRGPVLMGEFGLADDKWALSPYMKQDQEQAHFHNVLWASAMSGASGTALFWWWETLDQQDAYRHYRPLASFLADVPLNTAGLAPASPIVSGGPVRAVGLAGKDRACLWLCDLRATWWNRVVEKHSPEKIEGVKVQIAGLQPGRYRVRWWDTRQGKALSDSTVDHQGSALTLAAPSFASDIACRIDPAGL